MSKSFIVLAVLVTATACAGAAPTPRAQQPSVPPTADQTPLPSAPWQGARLAAAQVPAVFAQQWARAENRAGCALIAPASLGAGEGAVPRAATFSGGWAVAYDRPGLRSAFGVAGSSSLASAPSYNEWPYTRRWSDGSSAGYGPEGGRGPNQLAYLRIAGQSCLYNIWSNIGVEHLERLLEQLRFVETQGG